MDKKVVDKFWEELNKHYKAPELSYTDLISIVIKDALKQEKDIKVGSVSWDLDVDGKYLSSKKTLKVEHRGQSYTITIKNDNEK